MVEKINFTLKKSGKEFAIVIRGVFRTVFKVLKYFHGKTPS